MRLPDAQHMTDAQIAAELADLDRQWDELRELLKESGGHSGSPGEWIVERMDELLCQQRHRIATRPAGDGDAARREG